MRSKRFKGIMAVVLALACVLPMPVSGQTAGDTGKIDEYLLEKMEQYTGELPVYIWAKVDVDADVNDFVDAMDEQEFAQIVKEFRQSIGLEEDNFVFNEKYMYKMKRTFMTNTAPLTTAWLTKDEILALALEGNERILGIEYVPERGNTINYVPFFVRSYHAERALHILQVSVGLDSLILYGDDVDRNGMINAYDALLALQESVGLIAIGEVMNLYTWQSPILVEGAYDFERMPPDYFLWANDVNGDGVADALDIMLKNRDMWR